MKIPEPLVEAAHRVERRFGWTSLPLPVGVAVIAALRERLRSRNLFDTGVPPDLAVPEPNGDGEARHLTARMPDGSWNDLENPAIGIAGTRFSRNVPPEYTYPETEPQLSTPNPRTISRRLMTRDEFLPATSMNVLSAAWIQFEVHDWFSHGPNDPDEPYEIELEDDDDWHERPMQIRRTPRDETSDPRGPQTWRTRNTHWWDGTQIYGSGDLAVRERTGDGGKLRVDPDGLLPADLEDALDYSDVPGAMWTGLYAMHILFTLEHNAICDRLRSEHPTWSDERLYDKARLVNSALLAKIHILDFTPAVTSHPTWKYLMRVSWWGFAGERVWRTFGRISRIEEVSGIPGMKVNHFGHPYALSEEFVAVYRMHPLIPDEYTFRSLDDAVIAEHELPELLAPHARDRMGELTMPNVLYSLGRSHPGQITLHNYPRHLQRFERADGFTLDLAAVDVMRSRERGVPRYARFREFFHMRPVRTFEELTDNPVWREEIRELYDGDIDAVDLQVGLLAEPLMPGFAFSDTATRVFTLMAGRRLTSDRFFTTDYRPEVYTRAGLDWIADNSMRTVLLRHFPQLAPALEGVWNPFAPWRPMR